MNLAGWLDAWSAIMNNNGYLRPFAFGLAMLSASFFSTVVGAISKAEPAASPSVDPRILYGGDIVFDVYRAEDKVGFHRVAFDANVLGLTVRSRFQLKIDFLFLTAFSYDYQSTAEWHGGILNKLEARVDDNGNQSKILATRAENTMRIEHAGGRLETAAPLFPTNHWNAKVLGARRVLNTLTGRVNEVRIVPRGRETVATERGPVPATRYAYTGDLDNEVWYDDVGRWVKMRFKGRDGSTIDYVCRRCQGGPTGKRTP